MDFENTYIYKKNIDKLCIVGTTHHYFQGRNYH